LASVSPDHVRNRVNLSNSDIGDPVVAEFIADACAEVELETGQTIDHADYAVCDWHIYCPLCGAKMTPYTSDLTPTTYESEKGLNVLYVCNNNAPPYYSSQKHVEVRLR
jgi:hypothetical protein